MKSYFVTAIGTDCGKTVACAILCRALNADYWKPVQAGKPADSDWIRDHIQTICHPEQYFLKTPASPHYSSGIDGVNIELNSFRLPDTTNPLIIEGAGGMLVPLNDNEMVIDLAALFQWPVILVCNIYLGSINHSLLSIDYLKRSGLQVAGLIFNGEETPSTERIIEQHSPWPVILKIRPEKSLDTETLDKYASKIKEGDFFL